MTNKTVKVPWSKPKSIYHDDGPPMDKLEFTLHDVKFRVKRAGVRGIRTLRDRFQVDCLTCDMLVHEATTSATLNVKYHLFDAHSIDGDLEYTEETT